MLAILIHVGELGGFYYGNLLGGFPRVGFSFALGVLIYRAFARAGERQYRSNLSGIAAFVGLPIMLVLTFSPNSTDKESLLYSLLVITLVFPAIIFVGASVEISGSIAAIAEFLGDLSYPIYILHFPILYMMVVLLQYHYSVIFSVSIATVVVVAYLAHRFYDEPVRRIISRSKG